jgi:hypothetical protein
MESKFAEVQEIIDFEIEIDCKSHVNGNNLEHGLGLIPQHVFLYLPRAKELHNLSLVILLHVLRGGLRQTRLTRVRAGLILNFHVFFSLKWKVRNYY